MKMIPLIYGCSKDIFKMFLLLLIRNRKTLTGKFKIIYLTKESQSLIYIHKTQACIQAMLRLIEIIKI